MMSERDGNFVRAVFVHFAAPAAALCATGPYLADLNAEAQAEVVRDADQGRLAEIVGSQWIEMSEDRIGAEGLVVEERGRGANRRRAYVLGMSGSGAEREAKLFRVLTFLERVGALMTMGRVSPHDLAGYMRDDACRWREHLLDLKHRSEHAPTLDQARFEQLEKAITAAQMLCNDGPNVAIAASMWQPMRLIDEAVWSEGDQVLVTAVIRNDNMVAAPTPVLRLGSRAGYWLVFPSDAEIPANEEIYIRGRLPWPHDGIATGITLVTKESDFAAISDAQRFPNRGGQTRNYE